MIAFTIGTQSQIITAPSAYAVCSQNDFGVFVLPTKTPEILGNLSAVDYTVNYFLSQADAVAGTNPLQPTFINTSNPQQLFVSVVENANPANVQYTTITLIVNLTPPVQQVTYTVCDDNGDGYASIDLFSISETIWAQLGANANSVQINYYETQLDAQNQVNPLMSPYTNMVPNQTTIYANLQYTGSQCSAVDSVNILIQTCANGGEPADIVVCTDSETTCFDLSSNDVLILGQLNPADYTITYHISQADAESGVGAIATPASYCTNQQFQYIYARLQTNATGDYSVSQFAVVAQSTAIGNVQLGTVVQCDDNGDGVINFDLTVAATQINTSNTLVYYSNSNDLNAQVNPITMPQMWAIVSNFNVTTAVFIREIVPGDCDLVYTLPINALVNCNMAATCASANSLCSAIGQPFANTVNIPSADPGNYYGCLQSTPNPTWFYIPISTPGNVTLQIEQNTAIDFTGQALDVDFVCFGPYENPLLACTSGLLMSNYIVSCSYSPSAIEMASIPNGQPGQYYLIMVTNYSNLPGYVRIINQQSGQGEMDCNGIRLNAFRDSNSNGIFDEGEAPFPLGQFGYELNNDGTIHNITASSGSYSIYDIDETNGYDVNFTIDPDYAANYSLSTASYSNLTILPGSGLQDYFFPVTVSQPYNDLEVVVVPSNAPRPGFTYTNKVKYTNLGSQPVSSGTVTFDHDAAVTINTISQPGTVPTATGFTYNFTNLQPFESREMNVVMQIPTIPTVAIGDLLTNSASIVPLSGDIAPENNESNSSQLIIGSYDPNDKMESRGHQILISDFTPGDYLYYTIRFENTGTAAAINVKIADNLDSRLDPESLKMVDASHDYVLDRTESLLIWRFDHVNLPATMQNPTLSKGYVTFKVKPLPGYSVGDVIQNTAAIYFDFNPAIITNTFNSEFVTALATADFAQDSFKIYPNPAKSNVTISMANESTVKNVEIRNLLGKTVLKIEGSSTVTQVDVSSLQSGVYLIEVESSQKEKIVKKLVIN